MKRPIKRSSDRNYYCKFIKDKLTSMEVYQNIRQGAEYSFENFSEKIAMLNMLSVKETGIKFGSAPDWDKKGDVNFLNRIIRAGGLSKYARSLEGER